MISVGIDIGRSSIKVAEAEATARSFVVKRFIEHPLSIDPNKDRKIEIIDFLRNLIPQYGFESTRFVFCVRQEQVSMRLKRFPFRERHKILRTVPFEVEEEIPFSQADAVFEAKVVRTVGRMADVLAMACPKQTVKDAIQLAHDCSVHPSLISLETAALANLLERWDANPPELPPIEPALDIDKSGELLLDIGHASTRCLFFEDGVLVEVRNVDWGGANLISAVAQKYGLSLLQASRELQTKSFIAVDKSTATKEQVAFSKVVETSVNDLIKELRLKILEVKADRHLNIVRASFTGGPSQIRGLNNFLTQHLEIPFNKLKVLQLTPSLTFEATDAIEAVAGVAIGLAIEGLRRPRNPAVNFLKEEFAVQSKTFEKIWEKWGYTIQLCAAFFVVFCIYGFVRDTLSQSAEDASNDALKIQASAVANAKGTAAAPAKLRKFLADKDKQAKARKQAEKVLFLNSALDVVNQISSSIPEGSMVVDVKHLTVNGSIAEVHGYLSQGSLSELQKSFAASSMDGKVEVMGAGLPPQAGKQPFSFRFRVARAEGQ